MSCPKSSPGILLSPHGWLTLRNNFFGANIRLWVREHLAGPEKIAAQEIAQETRPGAEGQRGRVLAALVWPARGQALPSEGKGRVFESRRARQLYQ